MRLKDILQIGEAGPLPMVGLGLLTVTAAYLVPSLRPQMRSVLKASAKLFLEAELGADNALTDRLVDASLDALLRSGPDEASEERKRRTDRELDRFFGKARAGAHRRGFNHTDAKRRYHKHLSRMEHALKSVQERAGAGHRPALDHALHRIADEQRTLP
jgi:hypothetical protein